MLAFDSIALKTHLEICAIQMFYPILWKRCSLAWATDWIPRFASAQAFSRRENHETNQSKRLTLRFVHRYQFWREVISRERKSNFFVLLLHSPDTRQYSRLSVKLIPDGRVPLWKQKLVYKTTLSKGLLFHKCFGILRNLKHFFK